MISIKLRLNMKIHATVKLHLKSTLHPTSNLKIILALCQFKLPVLYNFCLCIGRIIFTKKLKISVFVLNMPSSFDGITAQNQTLASSIY